MKKFLMSAVLGAVVAMPAMAADMPLKAPPIAVAAAYNWSGCYIGAQVGWGRQRSDNSFSLTGADPFTAESNVNGTGGLAGGHVGCNWQNGRLVYGVEGDTQWTGMKGNDAQVGGDINELSTRWMATFRARVGVTLFSDRWLSYVTGGVAIAGLRSSVLNPATEQVDKTATGWTIGWGTEYGFTNNLSGRIESRWTGFGRQDFVHPINGYTERFNDVQIFTVHGGLTWRFGGPVVARY